MEELIEELMLEENPLVSIITVSLNAEKYIEGAIKSVLSQSYNNIEYILIDGGSKDNTVAIIKKYRDKISVLISERDYGISDAFNKGIRIAKGEIIGIVNSDDWLEEFAIKKIVSSFIQSGADIVCGGVNFCEKEKVLIASFPDLNRFENETSIHHAGVFVKKSVYEEYGSYDLSYKYAMDYEFLLRAKKEGAKFHMLHEILAGRRLHGFSYKNAKAALKETRRARENYFSALNVWSVYIYVWIKDFAGRLFKRGVLKPVYLNYWNRRNKKIISNSER